MILADLTLLAASSPKLMLSLARFDTLASDPVKLLRAQLGQTCNLERGRQACLSFYYLDSPPRSLAQSFGLCTK